MTRNAGSPIKIRELHRAMPKLGFHVVRRSGGHVTYEHRNGRRITITAPHGRAQVSKPVLVSIAGALGVRRRAAEQLILRNK